MKRVITWRPPLWLVAVLIAVTLMLSSGTGYVLGASQSAVQTGECTEAAEVCAKFGNFWKVWNIAENEFLDPTAADPDKMIAGAINGMLNTLNDQGHTRYNTAEEWREAQEGLQGEYRGIGAYVNQLGDLPVIVAPIEGSPAEAAGVQAGDIILSINGESTEGLSVDEVVGKIRGEPGTQVTLELRHLDQEAPVELTITRAEIVVPAVTWRMLPGNVAHLRLSQFQEQAKADMQRALDEAKQQGARALIVDVRNNPGGLLDQAIGVSSLFLPEGTPVLRVRDRDGDEQVYDANENNPETDLPMVVLINTGSASSSEIFAGAMQDNGRARVIGLETVGLGTVLTPRQLPDGSAVYIGTAEWLTPKGRKIRHEGVEPDIKVELPSGAQALTPTTAKKLSDQEILQTEDTQIKRALSVLGVNASAEGPAAISAR